VDLDDEGIVVGSNSDGMVVRTMDGSQTTIGGVYPVAINNHVRPLSAAATQSSPAPSPLPTPIPVPQILAWAGNALALWERQEDGRTWHPFGLEEMIPN